MFGNNGKVIHGERRGLDRDFYNQAYDAAVSQKLNRFGIRNVPPGTPNTDTNVFTVENDSGSTVEQYGILKPSTPIISPSTHLADFKTRQAFTGITPTADGDFVIMQGPALDGGLADGLFSGCSPVQINVTDAAHTRAKSGTSLTQLTSGDSGPAKILWKESGTGTKWAFVRLEGSAEAGESQVVETCLTSLSGSGTGLVDIDVSSMIDSNSSNFSISSGQLHIADAGEYYFEVLPVVVLNYDEVQIDNSDDWIVPASYTHIATSLGSYGTSGHGIDMFRADAERTGGNQLSRVHLPFYSYLSTTGGFAYNPTYTTSSNNGATQSHLNSASCNGFMIATKIQDLS